MTKTKNVAGIKYSLGENANENHELLKLLIFYIINF